MKPEEYAKEVELLECVTVEATDKAEAAIIWLHGLGADGHDFESLVPELKCPGFIRYVFPHAPHRAITINGGMMMRGWFDLFDLEFNQQPDMESIQKSAAQLDKLIQLQIDSGIPEHKIILAGFSQGGSVILSHLMESNRQCAGLIALSTALPYQNLDSITTKSTPIFLAHGNLDPVIPFSVAEKSNQLLQQKGFDLTWKVYNGMQHSLCLEEVEDIRHFILRVLS